MKAPGRGRACDRLVRARSARPLLLAMVVAAATGVGMAIQATGVLDRAEGATLDVRFALRGTRSAARIAVVGIDARTLAAAGVPRWPWPRRLQGELLRDVHEAGARLIVYDVQVTEPTAPAEDLALYHAISAARPVVMVTAEVGPRGATRILGGNANLRRIGALPAWDQFPVAADGEIRRIAPSFRGLGAVAAVVARALGRRDHLAPSARPLIDFPGEEGTVRETSAIAVLHHTESAQALRGRVVVVGATAASIGDQHAVAADGGSVMSGPELQADAILTALEGFPLRSVPFGLELELIAVSAALVGATAAFRSAGAGAAAGLLWCAVGALGAQLAFDRGMVIAVVAPLCTVALAVLGVGLVDLATVRRERALLQATFARYVPPDHVERVATLVESGRGLAEQLEATVMFCDLRGWTTIAEGVEPAELIASLNGYLGQVSEAVMDHGGSVVTFLGDGVMSVFGAPLPSPDHATRALAAGRRILAEVGADRVGVGLATGPVVSGTVGSGRRLEYAAIGDTTNVAARVQSLTRELGRPLLLTAATRERLGAKDRASLDCVGVHMVRGRELAIELWSVS
jgi:adenylate cyclase